MSPPASPFAFPAFRAFFAAKLASTLAQMMMVVVIGWQVYDLARASRSVPEAAFLLGMVGLAQFLPVFGLVLVVGIIADRLDRRHIARAAIALELLCAATLAGLALAGSTALWPLFAVAFVLGVARAFAAPSLSALAPNLVPPAVLPTAIAWNSIGWQVGAIGGPAAGGLLFALAPATPYLVACVLLLVALVALFLIAPVPRPAPSPLTPWQSMKEGLVYVRRNRIVLGAISLDLFAVLLGGATAMLPIYARDILMVGPDGLGLLRAAPAAGAALTALLLTQRPLKQGVGVKMFASVAIFGLATVVFGLSTLFWLSLASLVVLGAADMVSVYIRSSLIQLHTPDAMRGRVSSVSMLFVSASNELGEFESGVTAAAVGAVESVVIGGALAIVVTLLWARWFPELRNADRLDEAPVQGETAKAG
ncbi:MFS transporter [Sandaracinobacteroides saxicola]|uniref:MFS transporter n=1 Tax=Sandaracinobacteroides saxicola TaxID=2759707 RepID=A0A7G5IHC1_9SPHN|nr:MFS transporter [Sandaracinobacteroides saxicola]QMW22763.1 MFS transporter [Sandaracinobacteroides saxicola]